MGTSVQAHSRGRAADSRMESGPGRVQWKDMREPARQFPVQKQSPQSRVNNTPSGQTSDKKSAADHPILAQTYFKSIGTRTYVAQLKVASNGNHYLVLTEASRIKGSDDIRKTRIFVYSEDFKAFFDLVAQAQQSTQAHPVPREIAEERASFWRKVSRKRDARAAAR